MNTPENQGNEQNPNPASSVKPEDTPCVTRDTLPFYNPVFVKSDPPVNDTFGLSIQYLNKIGVDLPLKNRVYIQNVSILYKL